MQKIKELNNSDLLQNVHRLVALGRQTTAELLLHLAEVERRELHLEAGFSSMYRYLNEGLGFSEGAAYRRMQAARVAQRFPLILTMIRQGALHLAGVKLLQPVLTRENHRRLLDLAANKSKREIERLVASLAPKPDVADRVRRLPAQRPAVRQQSLPRVSESSAGTGSAALPTEHSVSAADGPGSRPLESSRSRPALPVGGTAPRQSAPGDVTPLSAGRFKVQFTADLQTVRRLEHARALLSHRQAGSDLNELFAQALAILCQQLEKQRFAITDRPRGKRSTGARADSAQPECLESEGSVPGDNLAAGSNGSRHIPHAIRREVFVRDAGQCTFVGPEGRRCAERRFLTFHHLEPWARSRRHSAEGISLLCQAHNLWEARRDFGAKHVERAIEVGRERAGQQVV